MGNEHSPIGGQIDIDRLAEAARRIISGEPVEVIAAALGCPPADVRELAEPLIAAGVGVRAAAAIAARGAAWYSRLLRRLFLRRHPEPPGPAESDG